jgi:hypothetical protein
MALGLVVTWVERLANGTRDREDRDRRCRAPPRISSVADLEQSSIHRPAAVAAKYARRPHSEDDGPGESILGAPRIDGDLLKPAVLVSPGTVAKYFARPATSPSQSWRTFLANHVGQIVAVDFFVDPTVTCHLLFVLVAHERLESCMSP